jgi:hypothetical protein
LRHTELIGNCTGADTAQLWAELWISLASLLRSYTALHGLRGNRQAQVEHNGDRIVARHGDKWLDLERAGATVTWKREDGSRGTLELMETGRLQSNAGEEEMDLTVEAWSRDLMRELPREFEQ